VEVGLGAARGDAAARPVRHEHPVEPSHDQDHRVFHALRVDIVRIEYRHPASRIEAARIGGLEEVDAPPVAGHLDVAHVQPEAPLRCLHQAGSLDGGALEVVLGGVPDLLEVNPVAGFCDGHPPPSSLSQRPALTPVQVEAGAIHIVDRARRAHPEARRAAFRLADDRALFGVEKRRQGEPALLEDRRHGRLPFSSLISHAPEVVKPKRWAAPLMSSGQGPVVPADFPVVPRGGNVKISRGDA
jgi:hypothetical protein